MIESNLPACPAFQTAGDLRMAAVHAINEALLKRDRVGVDNADVGELSAFFSACVTALSTELDVTAPTVSTRVRTATNTAVITMNSALEPSTSVPKSAFVFTPARTVTAVVVSGSVITITATGVIATDSLTYTKPATAYAAGGEQPNLGVRGKDGNLVATFTGVLA